MKRSLTFCLVFLIIMLLACQPKVSPLLNTHNENAFITSRPPDTDSALLNYIRPFKDSLQSAMGQMVVILPQKITHSRNNPHSLIGPWLCDILLAEGKKRFPNIPIDGALYNPGGIRLPQLQDTVRVRDIYELLPFDNTLVILELPGHLLQQWIEHTVKRGGWPMSHTFNIYVSKSTKTRIILHDQPLKPEKTYRILTNDYVANGGDDCGFLKGSQLKSTTEFIRDIVIDHFDSGDPSAIPRTPRIHFMTQTGN